MLKKFALQATLVAALVGASVVAAEAAVGGPNVSSNTTASVGAGQVTETDRGGPGPDTNVSDVASTGANTPGPSTSVAASSKASRNSESGSCHGLLRIFKKAGSC